MLVRANGRRHVDSAVMYRNEDQVGKAVVDSGLNREDVFISESFSNLRTYMRGI